MSDLDDLFGFPTDDWEDAPDDGEIEFGSLQAWVESMAAAQLSKFFGLTPEQLAKGPVIYFRINN